MLNRRRMLLLLPVLVLLALVIPSSAFGQATRTWVSGVGDDVNPCSRTAPCKTFAGAISKTANGGIINALDPGGYGCVTITKSMTIKGKGAGFASIAASGVNCVTVNAAATDKVVLYGLDIESNRLNVPSPNCVRVLVAASVRIEQSQISGCTSAGVDFEPSNAGAR